VTAPVRTARDWRDFLALPGAVYAGDPCHVPEIGREVRRVLDARGNPYFRHAGLTLFLARRGCSPCARAALVTDRRRLGDGRAFFGFLETLDDGEAVRDLFTALQARAASEGFDVLEGPYDPNHYSPLGVLLDGPDRLPAFFQPHDPSYLPGLLEAAGFEIVQRLQTLHNPDVGSTIRARYGTPRPPRARRDLTVRSFDPSRRLGDLERVREVFEDAFADNWRFLPVGAEEYRFSARHLGVVTRPEHLAIVEHGREPVAVLHCALDVNPALRRLDGRTGPLRLLRFFRDRRRIRDLVLVAVGVKRAWQRTRAFRLLLDAMCWMARDVRALSTTWISPGNLAAQRAAARLDLRPDRTLAIYGRRREAAHA